MNQAGPSRQQAPRPILDRTDWARVVALMEIAAGGQAELARETGISASQLSKWKAELRAEVTEETWWKALAYVGRMPPPVRDATLELWNRSLGRGEMFYTRPAGSAIAADDPFLIDYTLADPGPAWRERLRRGQWVRQPNRWIHVVGEEVPTFRAERRAAAALPTDDGALYVLELEASPPKARWWRELMVEILFRQGGTWKFEGRPEERRVDLVEATRLHALDQISRRAR
jgi:hypothetical protein